MAVGDPDVLSSEGFQSCLKCFPIHFNGEERDEKREKLKNDCVHCKQVYKSSTRDQDRLVRVGTVSISQKNEEQKWRKKSG